MFSIRPNQKSPISLNRYEDVNGRQTPTGSSLGRANNYKMVVMALYNFQAQNHRELGFKKGDVIYVKRQIDANWYTKK